MNTIGCNEMKTLAALIFSFGTLPCFAWEPDLVATSAAEVVSSISSELPDVVEYAPQEANTLAGRYSGTDGLSGDRLYLFSDGTYVFTHWADILPETIYEKGKWIFHAGVVSNTPDGSLPKATFPKDHCFLPLSLRGQTNVFLMGANWDYSYLMERKRPNDYYIFRLCAFENREHYDGTKDDSIKADLLQRAWRPDFFK